MMGMGGQAERSPNPGRVAQRDLKRVAEEKAKLDRAKEAFEEAVLRARASGETFRDIGDAAGLSHARIQQIVKKGAR